jgi:hypothetical protein
VKTAASAEATVFNRMTFVRRTCDDVKGKENVRRFLVDGILCDSSTLLVGEPKAGKSLFTAGLIASLLTGREFLGREVAVPEGGWRIAVWHTDDDSDKEYLDRIESVIPYESFKDSLFLYEVSGRVGCAEWESIRDVVMTDGCNLVIFDNMIQALTGSVNDDVVVRDFFHGVRVCVRNRIPVLIVTHSSEKIGEKGRKPQGPMGNTQISAAVRWQINLSRTTSGIWTLAGKGSIGDPGEIKFNAPVHDVPRYEVTTEATGEEKRSKARQRSKTTLDRNAEIAHFVVSECQGFNQKETAKRIAAKWSIYKASTCEKNLSQKLGFGTLVERQGTTWTYAEQRAAQAA